MYRFIVTANMPLLISLANFSYGDTCYYTISDVGCDPYNYGYVEERCPAFCDQNDMVGCAGQTDYLIKFPHFEDMDLNMVASSEEDLDGHVGWVGSDIDGVHDGTFLTCIEQGDCHCEELWVGNVRTFSCVRKDPYEWFEWFADPLEGTCEFETDEWDNSDPTASDPCGCFGDPECEYYCGY